MCSGSYDYGKLPAPYPALNVSEIDAFCAGEQAVVVAAQKWLIAHGGYDYNCMDFVADQGRLPAAADSPATCAAKVQALSQYKSATNGAVVIYGDRTDSAGYDDDTAAQAVAVFMLTRGPFWWMVLKSGSNSLNVSTAQLFLTDYGAPAGNMTSPAPNVFTRAYAGATVTLDCNNFTASFVPTTVQAE